MINSTEIVGVAVYDLVDDAKSPRKQTRLVEFDLVPRTVVGRTCQDGLYDATRALCLDVG